MLFGLFYFIFNALCDKERFVLKKNVLEIVSDRRLDDCIFVERSNLDNIDTVRVCEINRKSEIFLYNRYFPKLFFYSFPLSKLRNSSEKVSTNVKCFSNNRETLFGFKIEYDLANILVLEFYCADEKKLHVKRSRNEAYEGVYIFTRYKKNIESIENSLSYHEKLESVKNIFLEVSRKERLYLHKIFDTELDKVFVSEHFSPLFLDKAREIKQEKLEIANLCFKKFFSLSVPKSKDNQKCEQLKYFDERILKIIEKSLDLVKEANEDIENRIMIDKELKSSLAIKLDHLKKDLVVMCKALISKEIKELYYKVINNFKEIDDFVKNVMSKNNVNVEAILDCDIRKIDGFLEQYYLILMEYCDVLSKNHVMHTFSYYFLELENIDFNNRNPFKILRDIFIAKKLMNFLMSYKNDKTDFLIFSQTDYFRYELAFRVVKNSKDLLAALVSKKKKQIKTQSNIDYFCKKDLRYMKKLIGFIKKWQKMFEPIKDLETVSFNTILDGFSSQSNKIAADIREPSKKKLPNENKDLLTDKNVVKCDLLGANSFNCGTIDVSNEQHVPLISDNFFLNDKQIYNLVYLEANDETKKDLDSKQPYEEKEPDNKREEISGEINKSNDDEVYDSMKRKNECISRKDVIRCNKNQGSAIKNEKEDIPIIIKVPGIETDKSKFNNAESEFESKDQTFEKNSKKHLYLGTGYIIVCSILMVLLCVKLKNTN